jgi:predicted amidohydrolase
VVGKYRKSHRLPDEPIALGDELPVFDTPYGKIGLMIGSDHYWPEIPLVLALKGAEMVFWSTAPEAVPQSAPLDLKMRVRALDDQVTIVAADYAGELPYLCSNYPRYTGQPLARSYVVDRSGVVVADTGMHTGVAVATIDPQRRKDIFHLAFHEDRTLFHYLVDPQPKPAVHTGARRKIRVSIAQVFPEHGPNPRTDSVFARMLEEAGRRGSDVILMSEFGFPTNTPTAEKTFALVAEKARRHHSYVIIGGLHDPDLPDRNGRTTSWSYLWDRSGNRVGRYRISQYGGSQELPVFKTDFGVIGLMLCGDIYSQEICRSLVLQGAEIVFSGSQSWGASGTYNRWMNQVRAIDNGIYFANAHFPFSDIGQQSYVIDPYGQILAGSPYAQEAVITADVDLDAGQTWFARSTTPGPAGQKGYLSAYYPKVVPEKRADLRAVLLAGRRPELYHAIVERTLADRDHPDELKDRIGQPR